MKKLNTSLTPIILIGLYAIYSAISLLLGLLVYLPLTTLIIYDENKYVKQIIDYTPKIVGMLIMLLIVYTINKKISKTVILKLSKQCKICSYVIEPKDFKVVNAKKTCPKCNNKIIDN